MNGSCPTVTMTTKTTIRPNLRRMSTKYERLAIVERYKVVCPYCHSENTCYAEDRTVRHRIRLPVPVTDNSWEEDMMLIVDGQGEMLELADNERILCRDCIKDSGIPAMCEVIFD